MNAQSNPATNGSRTSNSRVIARLYTRINVWVYGATGGRLMNTIQGRPICLIEMTGARSGEKRTIPLVFVPDGDDLLLVASMGGAPTHPAWYFNLKQHPEVTVTQGGSRDLFRAALLTGSEYSDGWRLCVKHFPAYRQYQAQTERVIPVFRCTPSDTRRQEK